MQARRDSRTSILIFLEKKSAKHHFDFRGLLSSSPCSPARLNPNAVKLQPWPPFCLAAVHPLANHSSFIMPHAAQLARYALIFRGLQKQLVMAARAERRRFSWLDVVASEVQRCREIGDQEGCCAKFSVIPICSKPSQAHNLGSSQLRMGLDEM